MTFTHALSTDNYGPAKFIVSVNAYEGTHTTIAAALTSASSGDTIFIRPGTYTENLTLKVGVNLVAYSGDQTTPNVTIIGKATLTTAGSVTIGNILLQTNSDFVIVVSGTAASIINLQNCYINCTNNTGISVSSSNVTSGVNLYDCNGNLATTGIAYFSQSSNSNIHFTNGIYTNTGVSTTANIASGGAGNFRFNFVQFESFLSSTNGVVYTLNNSSINISLDGNGSYTNGIGVSLTGSGGNLFAINSAIGGGTSSAVSIGVGNTAGIYNCVIDSTNTNAITGAGTLDYSSLAFSASSSLLNVTTLVGLATDTGSISFDGGVNKLNVFKQGTFTPAVQGTGTAGTFTYTIQVGRYQRVGRIVSYYYRVAWSATPVGPTGTIQMNNFPFTSTNTTNVQSDVSTIPGSTQATGTTNPYPVFLFNNNATTGLEASFTNVGGTLTGDVANGRTASDYLINGQYEV